MASSVIKFTCTLVLFTPSLGFTSPQSLLPKRLSTSLSISTPSTATGEADRAFRLGIQLEKAGLARSASAAFHEAATLYQCFLDFDTNEHGADGETNRFQHVTTLSNDSSNDASNPNVRAVLAYACIRLAHLSHDAFGDSRAATRLYRLAKKIDTVPSAVAWSGIGNSIEASMDYLEDDDETVWRERMEKAVDAYKEAAKLGEGVYNSGEVLFHLAVALEVSFTSTAVSKRISPDLHLHLFKHRIC
jgi:hypothetical protein